MAYFLAGCALLVLLLLAGRQFAFANPRKLAGVDAQDGRRRGACRSRLPAGARRAAACHSARRVRAVADGAGRLVRARRSVCVVTARRRDRNPTSAPTGSRCSSTTTAGRWTGRASAGRFAGRTLSTLSDREAMELLAELHHEGAPEAALMEAYLDWRLPGWRDRRAGFGRGRRRPATRPRAQPTA